MNRIHGAIDTYHMVWDLWPHPMLRLWIQWVNHEFTDGGIVYARLAEFMCLSGQVLPFRDIKAKG